MRLDSRAWRSHRRAVIESVLQPPVRLQRAEGVGHIAVAAEDGRTRLKRLFQDGCAKIRLPRDSHARGLEAVLINTAGGLTGGDRLSWRAEAGPDAELTLTTQACERIYRAASDQAELRTDLEVGAGARLDWLPQETILFDGGAVRRHLEVDLAPGATFLAAEAVVLGRIASGETVRAGCLQDRWRVRRDGALIFADDLRLSGLMAELTGRPAVLAGARAFASVLMIDEDLPALLPAVRRILGDHGGASVFDGKLFCRAVAADGLALRRLLIPLLTLLRGGRPLPRVWRL